MSEKHLPTLKLYPDTNLIPWPTFPFAAVKRNKEYGLMFAALLFSGIYVSVTAAPGIIGFFSVIALITLGPVVFTLFLASRLTADVVVFRFDSSGWPCEDWQKWWNSDVLEWPDAYKFDFEGRRVLFIDGLEKSPLNFDPWIAELPKRSSAGDEPITGSRVSGERATSKAIDRIAKFRPQTTGDQIQQGLMVGAIAVSMIAILMAADRVATVMGQGI